jgi:hypothetical protein
LTNAGEKRLQAGVKAWSQAQARFETKFGSKRAAELRAMLRAVVATEFAPRAGHASSAGPNSGVRSLNKLAHAAS